ncbi:hypothetical protein H9Q73_013970, partial [Fusarium xylarioides]
SWRAFLALQLGQIFLLQPTSNTTLSIPADTTLQSSNTHYTVTMHTVRRSLQTPDPDEPYLTEGPNATEMKDMIDQAISSGDYYKLYDKAIEILKA